MYNYFRGTIAELNENLLVLDVGGIGYEFTISASTAADLDGKAGEVKIYAYLSVREDAMCLFGFSTPEEKHMFEKLLEVSGVGPKLAVTVLGGMTVERFVSAVVGGDVAALSSIKGVGKKTAERIALELRDKVNKDFAAEAAPSAQPARGTAAADEDAVLALMTLGYTRQEATRKVGSVQSNGMTLEEIVYAAIKNA